MKYADVLLPLPIYDDGLTYAVPPPLRERIAVGMSVTVPVGRSRHYTGIVVRVHDDKPPFETRDIYGITDALPVTTELQLRLWRWIAHYYMAPLGDVMKAAVPNLLRNESGIRPKTERCLVLAAPLEDISALQTARKALDGARYRRQQQALDTFLAMRRHGDDSRNGDDSVALVELRNECHCTDAPIRALIKRGFLVETQRRVRRTDITAPTCPPSPLNEAQSAAKEQIKQLFETKNVVLLHGVTSSGKTEIYIHLIKETLDEGKQALYILPEIALTVQIMRRLRAVFGDRLGIYHSKYSDVERAEVWQRQLSATPYDVVLGVRSAIFLPFDRLRLVIVDEEHETSLKQQDPSPRYHARSVAIVLAEMCRAKVLLGTATPSMETYWNAVTGKYGLVTLTQRHGNVALPAIKIVDIKDLRRRKMMRGPLSPPLISLVRDAIAGGKQAILFQNRRGYAPVLMCRQCGWTPHCDHCDVSLTVHKASGRLTCHYCGAMYAVPLTCPNCGSEELSRRGYGTERIEDAVAEALPESRVDRMDLDTTRTQGAYERIIDRFAAGESNLLIGTRMVSKGLDFGNVSVVGIVDADTLLNTPDFRAHEHAFAMLSQVSGRAGRRDDRGIVVLQTRNPEEALLQQVATNDYASFFRETLEERRLFAYPPFTRIIDVYLKHTKEPVADSAAALMAQLLRSALGAGVLGPDRPAVGRIAGQYIRKIMLKIARGTDTAWVRSVLRRAKEQTLAHKDYATVKIAFDVDPL